MRRQPLGNTGLEVSILGLGGHEYRWLHSGNIKEGRHVRFNPARLEVVKRARDCGINYFDTTFHEEVQSLGHVLARIGGREEVVVNGMIVDALRKTKGMAPQEMRRFIAEEIETRVELLGGPFDIFMLGAIDFAFDAQRASDVIEVLETHRRKGHYRILGVSCHSYDVLAGFLEAGAPVEVVMFPFNYARRHLEGEQLRRLSPVLKECGIGAVAMKPLCWTMYGVPFTAISGEWGDVQDLVRHSFGWQASQDYVDTSVVGVETIDELNSCVEGVAGGFDEGMLGPYLSSMDDAGLLVRNGLRHSEEIQGRIVELLRRRLGKDFGEDLSAYREAVAGD